MNVRRTYISIVMVDGSPFAEAFFGEGYVQQWTIIDLNDDDYDVI